MKHLLLILVLVVGGYAFWTLSDKTARKIATRSITEHGVKLGFIIVVVLLLVVAAANLPSTSLI